MRSRIKKVMRARMRPRSSGTRLRFSWPGQVKERRKSKPGNLLYAEVLLLRSLVGVWRVRRYTEASRSSIKRQRVNFPPGTREDSFVKGIPRPLCFPS